MTTIKIKKNDHESKLSLQAGIDVGSEELVLVIRKNNKPFDPQTFTNTPADRARLVKKLTKLPGIIVCLDDCMDAGGRAMQEQLPKLRESITLIWQSPCMMQACC